MTNTRPAPSTDSEHAQITIAGYRGLRLALAVVLRWSGGVDVRTIQDDDGRGYSLLEAARLLRTFATEAADVTEEDYPFVDHDGEWEITLDGQRVDDAAFVITYTHDGWQAAARIPDARRGILTHADAAHALNRIADNLEGEPGADGRLSLVTSR
jgi:hypothetical protein